MEFLEPTPPEQELVVRSSVTRVRESEQVGGGKATVEVSLTLHQARAPCARVCGVAESSL